VTSTWRIAVALVAQDRFQFDGRAARRQNRRSARRRPIDRAARAPRRTPVCTGRIQALPGSGGSRRRAARAAIRPVSMAVGDQDDASHVTAARRPRKLGQSFAHAGGFALRWCAQGLGRGRGHASPRNRSPRGGRGSHSENSGAASATILAARWARDGHGQAAPRSSSARRPPAGDMVGQQADLTQLHAGCNATHQTSPHGQQAQQQEREGATPARLPPERNRRNSDGQPRLPGKPAPAPVGQTARPTVTRQSVRTEWGVTIGFLGRPV